MPRYAKSFTERKRELKLATSFEATLPNGRRSKATDSWELYRRMGGFTRLWSKGFNDFILAGPRFECRVKTEWTSIRILDRMRCAVTRDRSPFTCICDEPRLAINSLFHIASEYSQ